MPFQLTNFGQLFWIALYRVLFRLTPRGMYRCEICLASTLTLAHAQHRIYRSLQPARNQLRNDLSSSDHDLYFDLDLFGHLSADLNIRRNLFRRWV
jgi:hypothetical protein